MSKNKFQQTVLKNGLKILGEISPHAKSSALGFFVNTGSRDEPSELAGVSHFLEHMMFKGTAKRSSMEVTLLLGNLAIQANAYTNNERTVFYGSCLPEYFADFHELLSDMLRPSLVVEEFETEKKVILEEIGMYQDRPHFYFFEKSLSEYFGNQGLGNSVLGSTESVSGITPQTMRAYFERRYVPGNMVLVASGKFDWNQFVENAEKYSGHWDSKQTNRELREFKQPKLKNICRRKNISQAQVLFLNRGPAAQSEDRYALTVLAVINGDGSGSRMYWDLVDPGIAESAGMDIDENDGLGCLFASASMEPNKLDSVKEKIQKIITQPLVFDAEDLERAKNKLCTRIVLSGEMPLGRLMGVGNDWLYRGVYQPLVEIMERVKQVNRKEIEEVASKYDFENWSEFVMLPE